MSTDDVVVRLRLADVAKFVRDVKTGRLAIDDLERKLTRTGTVAKKESSEYGGLGLWGATVGRVKYAVAGLALTLGTGAGALATFAITSTSRLEQVQVGFKTLLGSSGAAQKMVDQLQDFAAITPFQLTDLEKQTQMLLGFGMAAGQVIPSLTAMGDAVSAFGGSAADMDAIILAMGQIATKGHLSYDELRQLNEHKINAIKYLEPALGLHGAALQKAIEGKQIGSGTAIPIILAGMEKQFGGAMDAQSKTLAGIWSNIIDRATRAVTDRVSPFLPMFKSWLTDLYDHIPQIADSIGRAIARAIALGKKAWSLGAAIGGAVGDAHASGNYQGLGQQLGQQVPNLTGKAFGAIGQAASNPDSFATGESFGKKSIGFVFGFLQGLFDLGAWGTVIRKHWVSMLVTLVSLFPAGRAAGLFGKLLEKIPLLKALAPLFTKAGDGMARVGGPAWRLVTKIGGAIADSFRRVFPNLAFKLEYGLLRFLEAFGRSEHSLIVRARRWASRIIKAVVDNVLDFAWRGVGKVATSLYGLLITPLLGLVPQVREWASNVWSSIPDEFRKALNGVIDWWNGLHLSLPGGKEISLPRVPHLATGGTLTAGGTTMVGERGPELLSLPSGASVIPLPRLPQFTGDGGMGSVDVTLMLDGEVLMRRILRREDTAMARL